MDVDVRQVRVTTDAAPYDRPVAPSSNAKIRDVYQYGWEQRTRAEWLVPECDIDHVVQVVGLSIATSHKPADMLQPQEPRHD